MTHNKWTSTNTEDELPEFDARLVFGECEHVRELEMAALRRDVDVKTAYNESLEQMVFELRQGTQWLRGQVAQGTEALRAAQAAASAERRRADQATAEREALCSEVQRLTTAVDTSAREYAALHAEADTLRTCLREARRNTADAIELLTAERVRLGNRLVNRVIVALSGFPRLMMFARSGLRRVLGAS